eukprot:628262_1
MDSICCQLLCILKLPSTLTSRLDMSLQNVVQFKVLLDTLSMDEFDSFYSELTSVCDKRETITKSLFYLLLHENMHNSNVYESNANRIIKNIIDQRKPIHDPNKLVTTTYPVTFHTMPSIMISECASYLQLSGVTSLSLCNRHSYISCKSIPTSITSIIDPLWFDNYLRNYGNSPQHLAAQIGKLHQFRRIKHLVFCDDETNDDHETLQRWFPSRLDSLRIKNIQQQDTFICNLIAQMDVKHLHFDDMQTITLDEYFQIVCLNHNIEYLTLDDLWLHDAPPDGFELSQTCSFSHLSKLKGIACNRMDPIHLEDHELRYIIPNHLSKQLQSLHIHTASAGYHSHTSTHSWKDHNYSELHELCVSGIDCRELRDILHTATQLKRLHFSPNPRVLVFTESNEVLKTVLSRESVEYLSITSNCLLEPILQVVGILTDKECDIPKRKCFKLRLTTPQQTFVREHEEEFKQIFESDTVLFLLGLVSALQNLVTNDFMLFMQFRLDSMFGERIYNELKLWKENGFVGKHSKKCQVHLSSANTSYTLEEEDIYEEFEQITFALCNKNNDMGGHKFTQIWNMPCTHLDEVA